MKTQFKALTITILILTAHSFFSITQAENPLSIISNTLETFKKDYQQHKVFVNTDKSEYLAGETIWMKAYVVDATTHKPDPQAKNLNISLIDINGKPVTAQSLKVENGYSHSEFQVPDSLAEGNYQIRAYTTWMRNFDDRLYFQKEIFIHNPIEKNFIRFWDILRNRRFNNKLENKSEKMHFAFFPEGGNLVEGVNNRLAFHAVNELGAGQEIKGRLMDNDDNLILEFESVHNGMGVFSFKPEQGKKYKAKVELANGQEKNIKVPEALSEGYAMSTDIDDDKISVNIKSNFNPEKYNLSNEIFILAHTRGKPYHSEKGIINNGKLKTAIPVDKLPAGICHITIFDSNKTPLAERLVFIENNAVNEPSINITEKTISDESKELSVELFFESIARKNSSGNYSLSVIGSEKPLNNKNLNLATYLLITSDIAENLENPWYYLSGSNKETAIDLVMMTHGWRRFDWQKLLDNDFPEIKYEKSDGITLTGKVTAPSSAKSIGEYTIEMLIRKENEPIETYTTTTDNNGYFTFTGIDYYGLFTAEFSLERKIRQRTMDISLVTEDLRTGGFQKSFLTRPRTTVNRGDDWERTKRPKTYMDTRHHFVPKEQTTSQYGTPDQVIYMEDIQSNITSMMQLLRMHVRGLREVGGIITLRGVSSILGSNEPMFMIDGTQTHKSTFLSLNPHEVERLEVFSGPSTAMFGIRGTNGVLIAYTKKAESGRITAASYLLKGYTEPAEFYKSKIDVDKNIQTNTPRTIHWVPQIIPDANGLAKEKFSHKDKWNNISIIIEGVDNQGNVTYKIHKL